VIKLEQSEKYLNGLSEKEAEIRLKKYGLNEIQEKEEPFIKRILKRFLNPISIMIEIAAFLSVLVKKWEDFTVILIMLIINVGVDLWHEYKAVSALKVLKSKISKRARVLREGVWKEIDAKYLVPGDVIKIRIGDIVPADIKIIKSENLAVDESMITGESLPVNKKKGDVVYMNSIVKKGEAIAEVLNTGVNTFFGKAVKLVAKAERQKKSHFQEMVIKVGNFLIIVTIFIVLAIIIVELLKGRNFLEILRYSLILTVAAIPVALPAVLTVTMAIGALNLSRKDVIVSKLSSIEELAGVDILCADKTGTLTYNKMTIKEIFPYNSNKKEVIFYAGLASKEEDQDPLEIPIFNELKKESLYNLLKKFKVLNFIPFDPSIKRTEATVKSEKGEILIITKGAPQVILELCKLNDEEKQKIEKKVMEFAEKGFRTIAVAIKKENDEKFKFVGLISFYDPPRKDAKEYVSLLRNYGVDIKMITGDHLAIAKYIAKILGIGDKIYRIKDIKEKENIYLILTELISKALIKKFEYVSEKVAEKEAQKIVELVKKELKDKNISEAVIKKHESEIIEIIEKANGFAEVLPEDKYYIVDKLQKNKHIVGMTGDGVNDAPALKKADCGIAVANATDAARAAADIVLLKPGIKVIVDGIKIARKIFARMKSYTIYRIAETIRIIGFISLSIIFFNFYPITAVMIILLALLNDIPILSIAYDNVKISRDPVKWDMGEILLMSSVLGLAGIISSFFFVYLAFKWFNLPLNVIQTLVFLKLAIKGHGTLYNVRTMNRIWTKPWPSPILWVATFSTRIIATIIGIFGFGLLTPVSWKWAMAVWGYALIWLLLNDEIKVAVWKMYKRRRFLFSHHHFENMKKKLSY